MYYPQSIIEWKCSNFYALRIRNGEIRMMKFVYGAIAIMKDNVRGLKGGFYPQQ